MIVGSLRYNYKHFVYYYAVYTLKVCVYVIEKQIYPSWADYNVKLKNFKCTYRLIFVENEFATCAHSDHALEVPLSINYVILSIYIHIYTKVDFLSL